MTRRSEDPGPERRSGDRAARPRARPPTRAPTRASDDAHAARCRALIEHARDVVAVVRDDGTFDWLSPSATELFGETAGRLVGCRLDLLVHPDDARSARAFVTGADADATRRAEWRIRQADGATRVAEVVAADLRGDPAVGGVALALRDITDRKALEAQLERRAFHDPLTGLANRARFLDRVGHALERQKRASRSLGLLFLDIDRFKDINDTYGHAAGDEVLVRVAARLEGAIRSCDTAGRLSGDEFAVLLEDLRLPDDAGIVAERVQRAIWAPLAVAGVRLRVTASIGVAVAARAGGTPERLLRDADVAMYAAKSAGRGCWRVHDPVDTTEMPQPAGLTARTTDATAAGPAGSPPRGP